MEIAILIYFDSLLCNDCVLDDINSRSLCNKFTAAFSFFASIFISLQLSLFFLLTSISSEKFFVINLTSFPTVIIFHHSLNLYWY